MNEQDFEPLYNIIKNNPNEMWSRYEKYIINKCTGQEIKYKIDKEELIQDAYLYFIECCENYDPFYNGGKFLFVNYFNYKFNLWLVSYTQKKFKYKNKFKDTTKILYDDEEDINDINDYTYFNNIPYTEDCIQNLVECEIESILNNIPSQKRKVIKMVFEGYTQDEISKTLNISQSRVSFVLKEIKNFEQTLQNPKTTVAKKDFAKKIKILYNYLKYK